MASPVSTPVRFTPIAVLAVTLAVFACVVAYVTFWLRGGLREQVLDREAEALTEVGSMQLANEAEALAVAGLHDLPGQLLSAALKTSRLRGVFAVRVFDAGKRFGGAVPAAWSETPPADEDWLRLIAGRPVVRLHTRETAVEVIGLMPAVAPDEEAEPLLETWLPLRTAEGQSIAGVAQMWTDGHAIAREFRALDRRLLWQALMAWAAGAVIISVLHTWAFRRLADANRQLAQRSEDLLRANRELTLAAKTSALGAVTAHLMHELKNPVAGLEQFVANQSESSATGEAGEELAAASELTRRLRMMINDVVSVMRDEQSGATFELSGAEIAELAVDKVRPIAKGRGVELNATASATRQLTGRQANLLGLVLQNLLQNAIEASSRGAQVNLSVADDSRGLRFLVEDHGPGVPEAVLKQLFQPCPSGKVGGSGIGLALSQNLARQAGGEIELLRTGPAGTQFQLAIHINSET